MNTIRTKQLKRRAFTLMAIASIALVASTSFTNVAEAGRRDPRKKRRAASQQTPRQTERSEGGRIKVGWGGCSGCSQ